MQRATPAANYLRQLTGLRFVAAALVVVHHYGSFIAYPPGLSLASSLGRPAVAFFFLLSGFVLTYTYADRISDWASYTTFVRARLARLYPVYLLALLLMTSVALRTTNFVELSRLFGVSWLANVLLVQSFVPLQLFCECGAMPDELNVPVLHLWNLPAWSISSELFFYLLFPFVVAAVSKIVRMRTFLVTLCVVFALEVVGFVALVAWVSRHSADNEHAVAVLFEAAYMWPVLRVGEFVMGCVLGWAFLTYRSHLAVRSPRRGVVALVLLGSAVVGILAVAFVLGRIALPNADRPSMLPLALYAARWHIAFVPAFTALLAAVTVSESPVTRFLGSGFMVALGEASYSLYVIHFFSLSVLRETRSYLPVSIVVASCIAMLVCVAASLALYRWFEAPARRLLRGQSRRPEALVAATA
jgi:peptidoglycan/LPS O-acetylase OafA/YrhL